VRQTIAEKLDSLPIQSQYIGIIKALTIGDKHDVTQQQWDVFRQTGTVHLLAISGLHIGLVSGLMYFIVLSIGARLSFTSPQQFAAISAISVGLFYSALAGFSVPTQRSLLMLTIAMMAITWQRNVTATNTLALALVGVLLLDPLAVLSAGFWLSFLAVMLIVYSLAGRLGRARYGLSAIKIHWVTALGLAPLLLYYFQQISVVSPLSNFFTVPVISFLVVPLCLLGVLLLFFLPTLANQLFVLIDTIIHYLWLVLIEMVELPYATIQSALPPFYSVPLALVGVFILLAPKGLPARWLGLVMLLPLSFVDLIKPDTGQVRFTLLDLGQGLSAVVETSTHTLLFDSGAKYSDRYDMGSAVIIPFLTHRGINEIDTFIISHADNDHIGGAESIIKHTKVKQILSSVPDALAQHAVEQCRAGQSWVWDQVSFEILSPIEGALDGENNNSCVLKVSSNYGSLLLTGDIEKPAEQWLLQSSTEALNSDILIAPHHGSKTSSTRPFLEQVNPQIILVPAGYKNKFSFPHQQVIERYDDLMIPWVNTADRGALIVDVSSSVLDIKSARSIQGKYWNSRVE
jgi:competence protein ComEC